MANNNIWLLLGVAVLGYFVLTGTSPFAGSGGTTGGTTPPGTTINVPPIDVVCDSGTSPSPTFNAIDKLAPGTALTDGSIYAKKNGVNSWTAFTPGTAISNLEVGSTYTFAYGVNTTVMRGNESYGPIKEEAMPCKESFTENVELYQDATNLTFTAFNDADTAGGTTTLTTNDAATVTLKVRTASAEQVFGNPFIVDSAVTGTTGGRNKYPNVFCLDQNATMMDTPDFVRIRGGEAMNSVSTPHRDDVLFLNGASNGRIKTTNTSISTSCYELPVVTDSPIYIEIGLNSDDVNDPVDEQSYSTIQYRLFAADWFVNVDDGNLYWGVEDKNGNGVQTVPIDTKMGSTMTSVNLTIG